MKAVIYDAWGGADQLRIDERPMPEPGSGEVRIKIRASSVNPIDWKIREGMFECLFDYEFPIIPGWDAAGTIDAVGSDTPGWQIGERAYAYCRKGIAHDGTYAEYIVVPAHTVARPPASLSDTEACAVPLCALTAYQALIEYGKVRAGDAVLLHAGAGGVGSFALPIARKLGARVYTTASAANHDYCRVRGADHVIDYRKEDYREVIREMEPEGLALIFDCVGGSIAEESIDLLVPGGAVVCLNEPPDEARAEKAGIRAIRLYAEPNGKQLSEISAWIEAGELPLPELQVMTLEDAAEAMEMSQGQHVRGKIALTI